MQGKEFRKNPQTALIGPARQLRLSKKGVLERGIISIEAVCRPGHSCRTLSPPDTDWARLARVSKLAATLPISLGGNDERTDQHYRRAYGWMLWVEEPVLRELPVRRAEAPIQVQC